MPNVVGENGLQATGSIEAATDGRAVVQTFNADSTGIVTSTNPPAGTILAGLCSQNGLSVAMEITT
jgi:beta-lactam-binding protein with PASTA domain